MTSVPHPRTHCVIHMNCTLQLPWFTLGCRWCETQWWCHIIKRISVWRGDRFFSLSLRKSDLFQGGNKHTRTGYFSYHQTMQEHGGHKFDTSHHDFMTCVAFVLCPDVLSGGWLHPLVIICEGCWSTFNCCWGPTTKLQRKQNKWMLKESISHWTHSVVCAFALLAWYLVGKKQRCLWDRKTVIIRRKNMRQLGYCARAGK